MSCYFAIIGSANAATLPFGSSVEFIGNFNKTNDYALHSFEIDQTTDLALWTDSYSHQGFDPILTLYSDYGYQVAQNDDYEAFITQGKFDSTIFYTGLEAGAYQLLVTAFPTFPQNHLEDLGELMYEPFYNLEGNEGYYNAHISSGVLPPSAVPVPAAVWLFGSGIMGLISFNRKKAATNLAA